MNYKLLFTLLLITGSVLHAQERPVKKLSSDKRHDVAHDMIEKGSYYNAVHHLHDLVEKHPENTKYIMKLADAYFHSRDYENSLKWYKRVVDLEKDKVSLALFRYAEALKYLGKYTEAQEAFETFASSRYRDSRGENYKRFARQEVLSCEFALNNSSQEAPVRIIHLGDHVNSAYSEFAPVLKDDSTLIFSSLQSDEVITVEPDEPHPHVVKLYVSPKENEEWGPHYLMSGVNTTFENNANGAFSADGKRFYFSRCVQDHSGEMLCGIYMMCTDEEGKFGKPEKLHGINKKGFSTTQPAIGYARVGRDTLEVLYFSSNRKGGFGGYDIWYSVIDKKGKHGHPSNTGKKINTCRDEMTPFYDRSNSSLYFSSNYHPGFGGFDLFRSEGEIRSWTEPENLGKPFNSSVDDTYYVVRDNELSGFMVSNRPERPEEYYLTSKTCCDDIYEFRMKEDLFLLALNTQESVRSRIVSKDPERSYDFLDSVSVRSVFGDSLTASSDSSLTADLTLISASDSSTVRNTTYESEKTAEKTRRHWEYVSDNFASLKKERPDEFIDVSRIAGLQKEKQYYMLEPNREYIIFSTNDKDTSIVIFVTNEQRQIVRKITADTSRVKVVGESLGQVELVSVSVELPERSDSATIVRAGGEKEKVKNENEKNFTVTRFLNNLKSSKNDQLKVILNYDFDDEQFITDHAPSLDSLAMVMKEFGDIKILISAHTDNLGSDKYNQDLSERRAESIVRYLEKKGINRSRMIPKGYGEKRPLVPNQSPDGSDNEENRWLNRRAEITIIGGLN